MNRKRIKRIVSITMVMLVVVNLFNFIIDSKEIEVDAASTSIFGITTDVVIDLSMKTKNKQGIVRLNGDEIGIWNFIDEATLPQQRIEIMMNEGFKITGGMIDSFVEGSELNSYELYNDDSIVTDYNNGGNRLILTLKAGNQTSPKEEKEVKTYPQDYSDTAWWVKDSEDMLEENKYFGLDDVTYYDSILQLGIDSSKKYFVGLPSVSIWRYNNQDWKTFLRDYKEDDILNNKFKYTDKNASFNLAPLEKENEKVIEWEIFDPSRYDTPVTQIQRTSGTSNKINTTYNSNFIIDGTVNVTTRYGGYSFAQYVPFSNYSEIWKNVKYGGYTYSTASRQLDGINAIPKPKYGAIISPRPRGSHTGWVYPSDDGSAENYPRVIGIKQTDIMYFQVTTEKRTLSYNLGANMKLYLKDGDFTPGYKYTDTLGNEITKVKQGEVFNFDNITHKEGCDINTWIWTNDATGEIISTDETPPPMRAKEVGIITITLTATNNFGVTKSYTKSIEVIPSDSPIANFEFRNRVGESISQVVVGEEFSIFDLSEFTTYPIEKWEWSFLGQKQSIDNDDAIITLISRDENDPVPSGFENITLDAPGYYYYLLEVEDSEGNTSVIVVGIKVVNEVVYDKPTAVISHAKGESSKLEIEVDKDYQLSSEKSKFPTGRVKANEEWEYLLRFISTSRAGLYTWEVGQPPVKGIVSKFTVRLRVQDDLGTWSDWTYCEIETSAGSPPIAGFSINKVEATDDVDGEYPNLVTIYLDEKMKLENSSYSPAGRSLRYDWYISEEDGAEPIDSNFESEIKDLFYDHDSGRFELFNDDGTPKALGLYVFELRVRDSKQERSRYVGLMVNIVPRPPEADYPIPNYVFAEEEMNIIDTSKEGTAPLEGFKWSIDTDLDGQFDDYSNEGIISTVDGKKHSTLNYVPPMEGKIKVRLEVTDRLGLVDTIEKEVPVLPPIPVPVVEIRGSLKENRKVIIDGTKTVAPRTKPVTKYEFKIGTSYYQGNLTGTNIDAALLDALYKNKGIKKVEMRAMNIRGWSEWKEFEINIKEDFIPQGRASVSTIAFRDKHNDGKAIIRVDLGAIYSLDEDLIDYVELKYKWDSDNDGSFTDENEVIAGRMTDEEVAFEVDKIGKYLVYGEIKEEFGQDTIDIFVTDADRRRGPTTQSICEVSNISPTVSMTASKLGDMDIELNFINGNKDDENNLDVYKDYIKALTESKQINANININFFKKQSPVDGIKPSKRVKRYMFGYGDHRDDDGSIDVGELWTDNIGNVYFTSTYDRERYLFKMNRFGGASKTPISGGIATIDSNNNVYIHYRNSYTKIMPNGVKTSISESEVPLRYDRGDYYWDSKWNEHFALRGNKLYYIEGDTATAIYTKGSTEAIATVERYNGIDYIVIDNKLYKLINGNKQFIINIEDTSYGIDDIKIEDNFYRFAFSYYDTSQNKAIALERIYNKDTSQWITQDIAEYNYSYYTSTNVYYYENFAVLRSYKDGYSYNNAIESIIVNKLNRDTNKYDIRMTSYENNNMGMYYQPRLFLKNGYVYAGSKRVGPDGVNNYDIRGYNYTVDSEGYLFGIWSVNEIEDTDDWEEDEDSRIYLYANWYEESDYEAIDLLTVDDINTYLMNTSDPYKVDSINRYYGINVENNGIKSFLLYLKTREEDGSSRGYRTCLVKTVDGNVISVEELTGFSGSYVSVQGDYLIYLDSYTSLPYTLTFGAYNYKSGEVINQTFNVSNSYYIYNLKSDNGSFYACNNSLTDYATEFVKYSFNIDTRSFSSEIITKEEYNKGSGNRYSTSRQIMDSQNDSDYAFDYHIYIDDEYAYTIKGIRRYQSLSALVPFMYNNRTALAYSDESSVKGIVYDGAKPGDEIRKLDEFTTLAQYNQDNSKVSINVVKNGNILVRDYQSDLKDATEKHLDNIKTAYNDSKLSAYYITTPEMLVDVVNVLRSEYSDITDFELDADTLPNYLDQIINLEVEKLRQNKSQIMYAPVNSYINFSSYYEDYEDDPQYVSHSYLTLVHDSEKFIDSSYDNSMGLMEDSNKTINVSSYIQNNESYIKRLSKTGTYLIDYKTKDNPYNIAAFASYRKDSVPLYDKTYLVIHRIPIANFTAQINSSGVVSITDQSYDLDHTSRSDKGIAQKEWYWKYATDSTWRTGKPVTVDPTKTIYIKQRVQDIEGAWSNDKVVIIDPDADNLPPVAKFLSPDWILENEDLIITDVSYDPNGDEITERKVFVDDREIGSNFPSSLNPGTYKIGLKVKDVWGAWSDVYEKVIEVKKPNHLPTAILKILSTTDRSDNPGEGTVSNVLLNQVLNIIGSGESNDANDTIQKYHFRIEKDNMELYNKITPNRFNPILKLSDLKDAAESMGVDPEGDYTFYLSVLDNPSDSTIPPLWSEEAIIMVSTKKNNDPVANVTPSKTQVVIGQDITYIDNSTDPDNDPITEWHWVVTRIEDSKVIFDGITENPETEPPINLPEELGTYQYTYKVKDAPEDGRRGLYSEEKAFTVQVINNKPQAIFHIDNATKYPLKDLINFNEASTDIDGHEIVEWHWVIKDIDEGVNILDTKLTDNRVPIEKFPYESYFRVYLTVKDEYGLESDTVDELVIVVAPMVPTAPNKEAYTYDIVDITATTSEYAGNVFVNFDFGDAALNEKFNGDHIIQGKKCYRMAKGTDGQWHFPLNVSDEILNGSYTMSFYAQSNKGTIESTTATLTVKTPKYIELKVSPTTLLPTYHSGNVGVDYEIVVTADAKDKEPYMDDNEVYLTSTFLDLNVKMIPQSDGTWKYTVSSQDVYDKIAAKLPISGTGTIDFNVNAYRVNDLSKSDPATDTEIVNVSLIRKNTTPDIPDKEDPIDPSTPTTPTEQPEVFWLFKGSLKGTTKDLKDTITDGKFARFEGFNSIVDGYESVDIPASEYLIFENVFTYAPMEVRSVKAEIFNPSGNKITTAALWDQSEDSLSGSIAGSMLKQQFAEKLYKIPGTWSDGKYSVKYTATLLNGTESSITVPFMIYTPIWEDYSSDILQPIAEPLQGIPDTILLSSTNAFEEQNTLQIITSSYTDKIKVNLDTIEFYLFQDEKIGIDGDGSTSLESLSIDTADLKYKVDNLIIQKDQTNYIWTFDLYVVQNAPLIGEQTYDVIFTGYDGAGKWDTTERKHNLNPQRKSIEVLGIKLFDFKVTNITDHKFKKLFVNEDGTRIGKVFTIPDLAVDKTDHPDELLMKRGFAFYFEISSKGLSGPNDSVRIRPFFFGYNEDTGRYDKILDMYYLNENDRYALASTRGTRDAEDIVRIFYEKEMENLLGYHNELFLPTSLRGIQDSTQIWKGRYGIPPTAVFVPRGEENSPFNRIKDPILVYFDIEAIKDGAAKYNYIGKGQWEKESKDASGTPLNPTKYNQYAPGDVLLFDADGTAIDNYEARPTHLDYMYLD